MLESMSALHSSSRTEEECRLFVGFSLKTKEESGKKAYFTMKKDED